MKKLNTVETKKVNGGAITASSVAIGLGTAYGVYQAATGFYNLGYKIGVKINQKIRR